jgi:hypothetical protein
MKQKITFWIVCFLAVPTFLFAQSTYTLSGKVIDANGKALDGATVYLNKATDSVLVKTALTDENGKFSLAVAGGNYRLSIVMMGYPNYKQSDIKLEKNLDLPVIKLSATQTALKEVSVSSQRPLIEQKIDRTVVNPENMLTAAGGTALDALEKAPGVVVDQDAAITLKGKSVTIFVDDKPTYMSGTQLESYLKSLNISSIDQIELMTNPPARYDAAGNGGVINIRTKKNKVIGFNGGLNLTVKQGRYTKHNDNFNFNYRYNRVNVTGNFGYNRYNEFQDLTINRHFFTDAGLLYSNFIQKSYLRNVGENYSGRVGVDYYLSDKTTIGVNVMGITAPGHRPSPVNSTFTNAAGTLDSTVIADNNQRQTFQNGTINLNYRHQYDKNGRQLTADADYLAYVTNSNQSFDNSSYDANGNFKFRDLLTGQLPANIRIYSGKVDYDHPLANGVKLSAGIKSSYTHTDNTANYFYTLGGVTSPDYGKTNHFIYEENIQAAYLNASKDFKRLSIQAGLRFESTNSNGHQLGNVEKADSTFKRNYASLFPTLYMQYKLDTAGNHMLNLNYGRRIDRPYYQDLNPFLSPLDKFTYYTGNPFLRPSFTDNIELSHTFKSRFTTTLSYSRTRDNVDETIEIVNGIYYSRPGNIGRYDVKSASFNAQLDPAKWLGLTFYGLVEQIHSVSAFYTGTLNTKGTFFYVQPTFTFKPGRDWTAQIDGNYQSKVTTAQFTVGHRSKLNAAISKKLSPSTTIKLAGNDLLYSAKVNGVINNLKNTTASWHGVVDSRVAVLSLSYRFGKSIDNQRHHEANGAESEQNRVKN